MTAQIHERLIYEGKEMSMKYTPSFSKDHARIKPGDGKGAFINSTACYRRYIGTWEIKDGRFYLVGLEGNYQLVGNEPLFAGWFSGTLKVPTGKRVRYVHHGFLSGYEKELRITIANGIVVDTKEITDPDKERLDLF